MPRYCSADSSVNLDERWKEIEFRNGYVIYGNGSLLIEKPSGPGRYTCEARNNVGEDRKTSNVEVVGT